MEKTRQTKSRNNNNHNNCLAQEMSNILSVRHTLCWWGCLGAILALTEIVYHRRELRKLPWCATTISWAISGCPGPPEKYSRHGDNIFHDSFCSGFSHALAIADELVMSPVRTHSFRFMDLVSFPENSSPTSPLHPTPRILQPQQHQETNKSAANFLKTGVAISLTSF